MSRIATTLRLVRGVALTVDAAVGEDLVDVFRRRFPSIAACSSPTRPTYADGSRTTFPKSCTGLVASPRRRL